MAGAVVGMIMDDDVALSTDSPSSSVCWMPRRYPGIEPMCIGVDSRFTESIEVDVEQASTKVLDSRMIDENDIRYRTWPYFLSGDCLDSPG